MVTEIRLSALPKTWIVDIDGVILRHNGYLDGADLLLPGAKDVWGQFSLDDVVVLVSARPEMIREATLCVLRRHALRYDIAIFGVPTGERVLINDRKCSGMTTAYAVNLNRDEGLGGLRITIDRSL